MPPPPSFPQSGPPSSALPPPPPGTPIAPVAGVTRGGRGNRRWVIVGAVVALLIVLGIVGELVSRSNSQFTIVPSSSTDGTFTAGDCVKLNSTTVTKADCLGAHDGQIIQVVHGGQSCPSGTDEFDVTDGTGNLCIDKGNSQS